YDDTGRALLDGASGAAVVCLGHGNERVAAKMAEQAGTIAFAHGSQFVTPPVLELADRLAACAGDPGSRVYFASGGSEANETALKLASGSRGARGRPDRPHVVSRDISYPGATLGALAMSGPRHRRQLYEPLLTSLPRSATCYCYRCPFGVEPAGCALECAD